MPGLPQLPDLMKLLLAIDGFNTRRDILSDESIRFMTDTRNNYAPLDGKLQYTTEPGGEQEHSPVPHA